MSVSEVILVVAKDTLVLDDSNTFELVDPDLTVLGWVDYAMPKLRTKYSATLGTTSALGDYTKAWLTTNSLTGNLDALRTFMIAALDAIPVSHPAVNAMALNDLYLLYWKNVTL